MDSNLVYLTVSGSEYAWGSGTYSTLAGFQSASGQGAHDLLADPKFANATSWDLHLTEGSPAIDSADSGAPGLQSTDADRTAHVDDLNVTNTGLGSIAYDDRGAYEFQPTAAGPTAALTVDQTSGTAPLAITTSAYGSTAGSSPITSYTFDFGDGTLAGPQALPNAQHVYTSAGAFSVKVTVTDASGRTSSATSAITVTAAGPTAALTASPTTGAGPLTVTLDASKSAAGAVAISSYDFSFGDGSPDTIQNSATPSPVSHVYVGGTYNAVVTVTDTSGQKSTASQVITVSAVPPTATLTVSPSAGAPPLAVTADASASQAGSAALSTYKFDFGDGSNVVGPQAGATATHSYTKAGTYTVTVTVTDADGGTATATKTVTATGLSASLALSTYASNAPVQVTADGSGSTAGANPITSYTFDFGDGSAVVGPQTGTTATHTFTNAGSFTVALTVKDSAGTTATATKTITVVDVGPTAALSLSPTNGPAPQQVTADASGSTPGSSSVLSYTFDFGDGSATVGPQAGATANHTYTATGTYKVKVTVTDGNNMASSATSTETITAHVAPTATVTATPTTGAAPLVVTADASGSIAGSSPIATYKFDFGDGSSPTGPQASSNAPHTYTTVGNYTITVTVTDSSGGSGIATTQVTDTGPVPTHQWKLSDGSGTTAADSGSSAALPATLSGGSRLSPGGYAVFDGSSGYAATASGAIDTTKSFTVAAWVNLNALTGYQTFVTQQGAQAGGFHLEFENNGGQGNMWSFVRATSDTADTGYVRLNSPAGMPNTGVWTHLVGSWDAPTGTMALYVNGQLVGTTTDTSPIATAGPLVIGRGYAVGTANNYVNGDIADVRVYQQALSSNLASWLYQNTGFTGAGYVNPPSTANPAYTFAGTTDWNGDGNPDLIARDNASCNLYMYPGQGTTSEIPGTRALIGTGWCSFTFGGLADWQHTGLPGIIARDDATGIVWFYPNNSSGGSRIQIGTGWSGFTIAGIVDWNHDGHFDIIARDNSTGILWCYPGDATGGTTPRFQIGTGWGGFTIAGITDSNNDGHWDMVAREESTGNLWEYFGDATGGNAPRALIGSGWGGMTFASVTDWDKDGYIDILARTPSNGTLRIYNHNATPGATVSVKQIGTGW